MDPLRALSIGVAAHITAAAAGGPRYDPFLHSEERCSIDNAIWLCHSCSTLIDRDATALPALLLREWRQRAENAAAIAVGTGSKYRPIAAPEVRQEHSLGELAAIKALSEEFGCHIETQVQLPAGDGWLNLHGAVVRGEDLVAIEIRENHGNGIPYFQIEYLLDLCAKLTFKRFQKCVVYLAVVSDGPLESDEAVRTRLEALAVATPLEMHIRMYRLNTILAKYGL